MARTRRTSASSPQQSEERATALEDLLAKPHPDAQWFVVHTYSGYESKVKQNLERTVENQGLQDEIFRVIIPMEEEIEVRHGQRHTVTRKMYPGYVLVLMLPTEKAVATVRAIPNVTGFISTQDERGQLVPVPLREEEVQRILRRMEAEPPRVRVGLAKGQAVRIVDGPFRDFIGTVDEVMPEKGKVRILVSFFGRETPVELDFLQVERI